jgi:hypothetical protein
MIRTLVKRRSTWAITSKTSPTNPSDPFWTTHGQGLVKTLVKPLEHPLTLMSAGTFAAFSKFHLNTSNSPNTKVVYFFEGHNFHVGYHCWFEVQIGEKCKSTPVGTIHWSREFLHLGIKFVHKWLRKRPYALCKSCRGLIGLQLFYLSLGPLQFKNLEKNCCKPSQTKFNRVDTRHTRDIVRDVVAAHRTARLVRARRGPPPTAGPSVVLKPLCPGTVDAA